MRNDVNKRVSYPDILYRMQVHIMHNVYIYIERERENFMYIYAECTKTGSMVGGGSIYLYTYILFILFLELFSIEYGQWLNMSQCACPHIYIYILHKNMMYHLTTAFPHTSRILDRCKK